LRSLQELARLGGRLFLEVKAGFLKLGGLPEDATTRVGGEFATSRGFEEG
jgi:hypothetical protein